MKNTMIAIVVGWACLMGLTAEAALDWRIEWNETASPQTARVYIFNPERTRQSFSLETGDVAKITDEDDLSPQLIIGQDISLLLQPGERKIFDMLIYRDLDARQISTKGDVALYQLSVESYRTLNQYNDPSSRQYPVSLMAITPVEREGTADTRHIYRSGRGYWMISLSDHNHAAEQLIRTGNRLGALHASIQQAILFYTQGRIALTGEALKVWQTAFPELSVTPIVTPTPATGCSTFVTFVASNYTQYASTRKVTIGDVLSPRDRMTSAVVVAQDATYTVPANAQSSKFSVKAYLMSNKLTAPTTQTEYVSITKHDTDLEKAIRIGTAENYACVAIQDVVYYINHEVATPTTGKQLWDRLKNTTNTCKRSTCFQPCKPTSQYSGLMNLGLLIGTVVPIGMIFRRKGRN